MENGEIWPWITEKREKASRTCEKEGREREREEGGIEQLKDRGW